MGTGGSGTIFVSGCNLGCSFCQNYQVSQRNQVSPSEKDSASLGKAVSPEKFAAICAALRDAGAENVNIVTGSHAVPGLIDGFNAMRKAGVNLPILWNSSCYDGKEALELLKDYVDIYLPDLKTLDSKIAAKFFNAPDYPEIAVEAVLKMIEFTRNKNKVIIRHLILPGYLESTRSVLRWFADNAKENALLSLMTQYTPIPGRDRDMPQEYLSVEEYETVVQWLEEFGIEDGFCQELVTNSDARRADWLPDFKKENPFPSKLSTPVWSRSSNRI